MRKNKNKQFEKQMRSILMAIDSNKEIDLSDESIKRCIWECHERNYISGAHCTGRSTGNKILISLNNPHVEKAGYEFLYPKTNWIQIITLIASIIAALCSIAELIIKLV